MIRMMAVKGENEYGVTQYSCPDCELTLAYGFVKTMKVCDCPNRRWEQEWDSDIPEALQMPVPADYQAPDEVTIEATRTSYMGEAQFNCPDCKEGVGSGIARERDRCGCKDRDWRRDGLSQPSVARLRLGAL